MQKVKLKRADLEAALKKNRDNHRAVFEEAVKNYRERLIDELDRRLNDLQDGKRIDLNFYFPEPEDHTKDYDRVIRMVEMSIDDTFELTQSEFAQYVMDDWQWRRAWVENTASYTANYMSEKARTQ